MFLFIVLNIMSVFRDRSDVCSNLCSFIWIGISWSCSIWFFRVSRIEIDNKQKKNLSSSTTTINNNRTVNYVASLQPLRAEAMAVKREFAALCNDESYLESLITLLQLEQQNAPSMLTTTPLHVSSSSPPSSSSIDNIDTVSTTSNPATTATIDSIVDNSNSVIVDQTISDDQKNVE
jgi:hypothetical protein